MTDVALMAVYSIALTMSAGCLGFTLGRWLGERAGRTEAIVEEAFWQAMEQQRKNEARGRIMIWSPPLGNGPN